MTTTEELIYEEKKGIATTIISQLGGNQIVPLLGIKFITIIQERMGGVQFRFKGSRKYNTCRIILDWTDTYIFELWQITKKQTTKKYEADQVYCDMLKPLFEQETGLYLSLF